VTNTSTVTLTPTETPTGTFVICLTDLPGAVAFMENEPNSISTPQEIGSLNIGDAYYADGKLMGEEGDEDGFAFSTASDGQVEVWLECFTTSELENDLDLALYDEKGAELLQSTGANLTEYLTATLKAGVYTMGVFSKASRNANYRLMVRSGDAFTPTVTLTPTQSLTPTVTGTPTDTPVPLPICTASPVSVPVAETTADNDAWGTGQHFGSLSPSNDVVVLGSLSATDQIDWYHFTSGVTGPTQFSVILDCFDTGSGANQFCIEMRDNSVQEIFSCSTGAVQAGTHECYPLEEHHVSVMRNLAGEGAYRLTLRAAGPTYTPTPTQSLTRTVTRTFTRTLTPSPTLTFSRTFTVTNTSTRTRTPTPSVTPSATGTFTPTFTATHTATATATATQIHPFVMDFGTQGSEDGNYYNPEGLVYDGSGNLYVADTDNNRVQRVTTSGVFQRKWDTYLDLDDLPQSLSAPYAAAVNTSSGYLYVVDTGNNRIVQFWTTGGYMRTWGSVGTGSGLFSGPEGIAVDSSGFVYVADTGNHRIQKFQSDGSFYDTWGVQGNANNQFQSPRDVAVNTLGQLFVADTGNDRIVRYGTTGFYETQWGTSGFGDSQFGTISGVAVGGPNGYVYVADQERANIQEFTPDGVFVRKWGTYGFNPGELVVPTGIAVDDAGYVYVTDSKVKKFAP
jgi:sugar lactone lactonase YvrE